MRKILIGLLAVCGLVLGLSMVAYLFHASRHSNSATRAVVDLNAPGAMDVLARENPVHYAKIKKILAEVRRHSDAVVRAWMKAEFDADRASYSSLSMTSDPAQRELSFILDQTWYHVTVIDRARR